MAVYGDVTSGNRFAPMPFIPRHQVTKSDVEEVLDYFPDTGEFRWKIWTRGHGKVMSPGDDAGWISIGYRHLCLYQNEYRAHRVAWLLMTGNWAPESMDIDHIDRDGCNNAWGNLRLASRSENCMNSKIRSDNTSGARGVHKSRAGKWFARICKDGRIIGLGTYERKQDAINARAEAEKRLFGEFSCP